MPLLGLWLPAVLTPQQSGTAAKVNHLTANALALLLSINVDSTRQKRFAHNAEDPPPWPIGSSGGSSQTGSVVVMRAQALKVWSLPFDTEAGVCVVVEPGI